MEKSGKLKAESGKLKVESPLSLSAHAMDIASVDKLNGESICRRECVCPCAIVHANHHSFLGEPCSARALNQSTFLTESPERDSAFTSISYANHSVLLFAPRPHGRVMRCE